MFDVISGFIGLALVFVLFFYLVKLHKKENEAFIAKENKQLELYEALLKQLEKL